MLEKPNIADEQVTDSLSDSYGLHINDITFLPLGADRNTAVYRAVAEDGTAYFVKLRRDDFNEVSVIVPKLLHDQGVQQLIAPLVSLAGNLWIPVGDFHLTVYPFVTGKNGYEIPLTDDHWMEFGRALKALHTAILPPEIAARIPQETYTGHFREIVRQFQTQAEHATYDDPISAGLAAFYRERRTDIDALIRRAERLAAVLQANPRDFVLCHADIHAANWLIQEDGTFYIVDWDTILLAPKERDLMFVAGGQYGDERTPDEEEAIFYRGYGDTQADPVGLAYYRYERIVQDIAAYSEEILYTDTGSPDRPIGLQRLGNNFLLNGTIETAYRTEPFLPPELRGL